MANKARFSFPKNVNVNVKGRQRESKPVKFQQVKVQHSDFDEVRAKIRQIGKGKQTLTLITPLFSDRKVVVKLPPKKKDKET